MKIRGLEVPGIEPPYDLAFQELIEEKGSSHYALYRGLRATDLSLRIARANVEKHEAVIVGTLTGAGVHPQPQGYRTDLIVANEKGEAIG